MRSDRNRAPRYPWVADAEVTETASRTRIRAQTRDLSIGGCFITVLNPSLEGTEEESQSLTEEPRSLRWARS